MSALGVGLFFGSVVAIFLSFSAFEEDNEFPIKSLLLVAGSVAIFVTPSVIEGFWGFIVGAAVPPLMLYFLRYGAIQEIGERRRLEAEKKEQARLERIERKKLARSKRDKWVEGLAADAQSNACKARMLEDGSGQDCVVMFARGRNAVRIIPYQLDEEFFELDAIELALTDIISLDIARPKVTKTRKKTVPVSIVENKRKSPVGRAAVGGVLLGPVGAVVGAASGLNAKTETRIENREVSERYETDGDPQLVVGTKLDDFPVLKLKFDPVANAETWMFKIRGAQS